MFLFTIDRLTSLSVTFVLLSLIWSLFLIFEANHGKRPISLLASIGLLCHTIPSIFLFGVVIVAKRSSDSPLIWLIALLIFRYWRALVNIFFWSRYKVALADHDLNITAEDCTVIVPTVGITGNWVFEEMVTAILFNCPARLIFSTNTESAFDDIKATLPKVLANIKSGKTGYQIEHSIGPFVSISEILVSNANASNKRYQVVHALREVKTQILAMVDDTAIWQPRFLEASLPAFADNKVGLVGTRKWVKRIPYVHHPNVGFFANLWNGYKAGFWNTIGGLYLIRHNFEIRATNAADGGVFCVSGRSSLIRTRILNNAGFSNAFLNEYVLRFGDRFPRWGPVTADDDNFITRWVINHGFTIKIQSSQDATMTTVLGGYPLKFPDQCKRWSRTTFRQTPIALFIERRVWILWPLTVWTTLFPWTYNAALLWDSLAVYTLTRTEMYISSSHRGLITCALIALIWVSKLVKTVPWFWAYPKDFFLYFLIPAYPLFVYWHLAHQGVHCLHVLGSRLVRTYIQVENHASLAFLFLPLGQHCICFDSLSGNPAS